MLFITNGREPVRAWRMYCTVLALGLVSALIASCTSGGSGPQGRISSAPTSTSAPSQHVSGPPQANQVQAHLSDAETTRVHIWLACQTAACRTGPGGGLKVPLPSGPGGGGLAPPDTAPAARFDWSMPPRFDASWHAWRSYASIEFDRPDDTCDEDPCVGTEQLYDYNPSFVNPPHWNPFFNACASSDGGSPLGSFQWGLWRDGREIDTAHTSYCILRNYSSDPPDRRLDVPALGSYFVTLSVTNRDGESASTVQEVTVRDLLIVTFGDSSASGEGNRASSGWEDRRCHRSRTSGPALAAKYLEDVDPKTSVTYLDFACSGASVTNGIIGPYYGEQREPFEVAPLEPQTDALVRAICGGRPAWRCQPSQQRPVDILTINIGVNDLRFADLLEDCDLHACLDHHWGTAIPRELADILKHNSHAPSCETAQQRFEQIQTQGSAESRKFETLPAIGAANKDCDTNYWGHSFQYIAYRLNDEGVKVAQTYMTTYPADIFSGARYQGETTPGCGILSGIGQDEAEFMTGWGYRLNDVIENEAMRLGWYPVTGLVEAFRGHGYCAVRQLNGSPPPYKSCPDSQCCQEPECVTASWFVGYSESEDSQHNMKGTVHPNGEGHAAWAARYLAAIAAPKPSRAPDFIVRVHLRAFRVFVTGIGPEGNTGGCTGNLWSGIPVTLYAFASLSEAGFDKTEAEATYRVTMKPAAFQFQPSEWYQFPGDSVLTSPRDAVLSFPLSSVDRALDVTIESLLCSAFPPGTGLETIHIHRLRHTSDGSDLAGPFQLRSSPGTRAIEISGCIEVASAAPQLPHLPTGYGFCQQEQLAPS
jgi:hypothetical protein